MRKLRVWFLGATGFLALMGVSKLALAAGTVAPVINTGDTAWVLISAGLVFLMTPGLAFFYGGLCGRKNVLGIMIQSFVSMGWTTVLWFICGYSMCFGPSVGGIIGNPFTHAFLRGIDLHSLDQGNTALGIPTFVHVAYQMMFAIITRP